MELYLTPEFCQKNNKQLRNKKGQFIAGSEPWNKGCKNIKLSDGFIASQFKKGNKPHNQKENFSVSFRYHKKDKKVYRFKKNSNGKWVLMQRYVWEQYNGPIPKDHVIRFRDGNSENYNIENLELISRSENMKRNINRKKQKESMKKTWHLAHLRNKYGLNPTNGFEKILTRKIY